MEIIQRIDWEKVNGLIPAVIQSADDYSVLMLGYMNKEALQKTVESGLVTFYSRSKQRLWQKGESSGNFLSVRKIFLDCDQDTLLIQVVPKETVCHCGSFSCFSTDDKSLAFTKYLERVMDKRIQDKSESSYVYKLINKGKSRIAQKVGEEAFEVALASIEENKAKLAEESADLLFHLLVNLKHHGLGFNDVIGVLKERHEAKNG